MFTIQASQAAERRLMKFKWCDSWEHFCTTLKWVETLKASTLPMCGSCHEYLRLMMEKELLSVPIPEPYDNSRANLASEVCKASFKQRSQGIQKETRHSLSIDFCNGK